MFADRRTLWIEVLVDRRSGFEWRGRLDARSVQGGIATLWFD